MITKYSNQGIRCLECSRPACEEAGGAPYCTMHWKAMQLKKEALCKAEAEAEPIPRSIREAAYTGDLHNAVPGQ